MSADAANPNSQMTRAPFGALRGSWRYHGEAALVGAVSIAMERSSWDACRRAGAWLGLAMFAGLKQRRELSTANVRMAFPNMNRAMAQQIARRSMQNFGMTFCEFLHLRAASAEEVRDYASFDGLEHIETALSRGHGCILLTAHLGNWEMMGARAAQEFDLTVVARPTANRRVEAHIQACREAGGLRVLSKYDTARAGMQVLRDNGTLGILPDQHAGPSGLHLPLFGHLTRVVAAPFKMAQLSRALVVPAYGVRREPWLRDGRIVSRVSEGFTVPRSGDRDAHLKAATQRGLHELERIVRAHPAQWLWMHKRWRDDDHIADASEVNAIQTPPHRNEFHVTGAA